MENKLTPPPKTNSLDVSPILFELKSLCALGALGGQKVLKILILITVFFLAGLFQKFFLDSHVYGGDHDPTN
jgi:hypothetical protein